ncbi:MAG: hypothetical protein ACKO26_12665 [Planctomycetota bacterium]
MKANRISLSESRQMLRYYEAAIDGYTYLE